MTVSGPSATGANSIYHKAEQHCQNVTDVVVAQKESTSFSFEFKLPDLYHPSALFQERGCPVTWVFILNLPQPV